MLFFEHVVNALLLFQELQLKAPPEKSAGLSVFSFSMAILSMPESELRSQLARVTVQKSHAFNCVGLLLSLRVQNGSFRTVTSSYNPLGRLG